MSGPARRRPRLRIALAAGLALLALGSSGCEQAARILTTVPRVITPSSSSEQRADITASTTSPSPELPPEQTVEGYEWEPLGTDGSGQLQFRIRILAGGSPSMVAADKLTPLFSVDGKNAAQYVTDAYFQANPHRTPRTIQPGDEFVLTLPPDTFVVRWQEERVEDLGGPVHLIEYVSESGDRLRYYESLRFPILYELDPADGSGTATVRLHPDLAYLLGSGQLDPVRLARLVYRVPDPDLFQIGEMRRLAEEAQPGQSAELTVDRTRTYLDPIREAMAHAASVEQVQEPGREHLTRARFTREQGTPFLAVEDALGARTDIADLPPGQVFRIEYGWDGVVRVAYLTGDDDGRGRRDPYALRENERWAGIYDRSDLGDDRPVAWGPGEPSDLPPFPTARDPYRKTKDGERSYDYLIPGRVIQLTFRPTRTYADARAQAEFQAAVRSLRDQYHDEFMVLFELFGPGRR